MRFEDKIQDIVEARDARLIDNMGLLYENEEMVKAAELIMSEEGYHCDDDSDRMDEIMLELARGERGWLFGGDEAI